MLYERGECILSYLRARVHAPMSTKREMMEAASCIIDCMNQAGHESRVLGGEYLRDVFRMPHGARIFQCVMEEFYDHYAWGGMPLAYVNYPHNVSSLFPGSVLTAFDGMYCYLCPHLKEPEAGAQLVKGVMMEALRHSARDTLMSAIALGLHAIFANEGWSFSSRAKLTMEFWAYTSKGLEPIQITIRSRRSGSPVLEVLYDGPPHEFRDFAYERLPELIADAQRGSEARPQLPMPNVKISLSVNGAKEVSFTNMSAWKYSRRPVIIIPEEGART